MDEYNYMEKNIKKYLLEKFMNMFNELSDKDWSFRSFLDVETLSLEFFFSCTYGASEERMIIHGFSDPEITYIYDLSLDFSFFEFEKRYSLEIELNEEEGDEELLERFVSDCSNTIISSAMFQSYMEIIEYHNCLEDSSRKEMCSYLEKLIINKELVFNRETKYEDEDGFTYCFQGEYDDVIIEIELHDSEKIEDLCIEKPTPECINIKYDEDFEFELSSNFEADKLIIYYDDFLIMRFEGEKCNEIRDLLKVEPKQVIGIEDFIIKTSVLQCIIKEHHLNKINALVNIDNGVKISEYQANAYFCPECNKYYITESEYRNLSDIGRLCCKVITTEELRSINNVGYDSWAKRGLLNCYGWNVNAASNLSSSERQRILSFVIENEIMSLPQVIDFISWLAGRPSSSGKNMTNARRKWQEDIDYLQNYIPASGVVKVGKLYKKQYKRK